MSYQETLTEKLGDTSGNINAEAALSNWYGPDSLACHSVNPETGTGYFVVTQNLCDISKKPRMFGRLTYKGGVAQVRTAVEDAREHFVNNVGFKVVPGHNLVGLMKVVAEDGYIQNQGPMNLLSNLALASFDFIRFKDMVLPGQELEISGPLKTDKDGVTMSPLIKHGEVRKAMGKNFRFDFKGSDLGALRPDWLIEAGAQAMGVLGLSRLETDKEIVPILMEVGRSRFASQRIMPEDILVTEVEVLSADEQMMSGNITQSLWGEGVVSEQNGLMLMFAPMDEVRKKIEEARAA